nr:PREDICTED: serine/threonine-protein kinase Nek11 [Anolis carolinensis]|eukprot:XP_016849891.1 PREDICTED: serine/threonine-protein kinase Nek11 [Anolis carolinensis]
MLRFQEVKPGTSLTSVSAGSKTLIAGRYTIQQKLGCGSFGTVYLVSDKKAKGGEEESKVLKKISVGDLKPNETVEANLEAQLLSRLDHPAIVKFYTSFVEGESFCIITEYCEGGDLDFKIQEYKEANHVFSESQIAEWFIQLLLGVSYMHDRRILHRDLKAKNIFLKNNLVKIGDFGVSRLLMGSCDLATTFTGTPFYMSPEALQHQGYDTKSDIWQKKVHLQTLRALSEVQKMTPRERMRLRKLNIADETAQKLKKLAEEKYQENHKRMQELRSQNFHQAKIDVLHESDEQNGEYLVKSQQEIALDYLSIGFSDQSDSSTTDRLCMSEREDNEIPEDPLIAEEYYNDVFDSCSETSEDQEEEVDMEADEVKEDEEEDTLFTMYTTNQQDSDVEAMVRHMENILNTNSLGTGTATSMTPLGPQGSRVPNDTTAATKLRRMRESAIQKLGAEIFENVYRFLRQARREHVSEDKIREYLEKIVPRASDCFEVDQLIYFEDQLEDAAV